MRFDIDLNFDFDSLRNSIGASFDLSESGGHEFGHESFEQLHGRNAEMDPLIAQSQRMVG
jgi:hypothetical protein